MPPDALTINDLLQINDSEVIKQIVPTFLLQLKHSPSVKSVFFPKAKTPTPGEPRHLAPHVHEIAAALVCSSIGSSSLHGFSGLVDAGKARKLWREKIGQQPTSEIAEQIYAHYFPSHAKSPHHTFEDFCHDKPKWAGELEKHLLGKAFTTSELFKKELNSPHWSKEIGLFLYMLKELDPGKEQHVMKKWGELYEQIQHKPFGHDRYISVNDFQDDMFLSEVNAAISVKEERSSSYSSPAGGDGAHIPTTHYHEWYVYGDKVVSFLKVEPKKLALTTGELDQFAGNIENRNSGSSGCFLPGTPVLLANGLEVPVETIKKGSQIFAKDGVTAHQTGEDVVIPLKAGERVYGFNELAPFFTAGHLFWTLQGWKAIDPRVALTENPHLDVGKLVVGDRLWQLKTVEPVSYQEIEIKNFNSREVVEGERVYGLHLDEGHPSYHVHGFLVRMNYPVMTKQRLMEGFATLSGPERELLVRQLQPVMPLLNKAVGPFIEAHLLEAISGDALTRPVVESKYHQAVNFFAAPSRAFDMQGTRREPIALAGPVMLTASADRSAPSAAPKHAQLTFSGGELFVNGCLIASPEYDEEKGMLSWSQLTKTHFSKGALHFTPDRLGFTGKVCHAASLEAAVMENVVGASPDPIFYKTQISKAAGKGDGVPKHLGDNPEAGITLKLQAEIRHGKVHSGVYVLCQPDETKVWQDISSGDTNLVARVSKLVNGKHVLELLFTRGLVGDSALQFMLLAVGESGKDVWPAKGHLVFDLNSGEYTGSMQKIIDPEGDLLDDKNLSENYFWSATETLNPIPAPAETVRLFRATDRSAAEKIILAKPAEATGALDWHAEGDRLDLVSSAAAPADIATLLSASDKLSVYSLLSNTPPVDKVQELANTMLIENMKWALGIDHPDWLSGYFGENRPNLSHSRIKVVEKKDGVGFYNRFATAYLAHGFDSIPSDSGGFSDPLSKAEKAKLDDFLTTGLPLESGYADQSQAIFIQAYVEIARHRNSLDEYFDDAEHWANAVFDEITSSSRITNIMMQLDMTEGLAAAREEINTNTTLLTALDPSMKYAKKYHEQLVIYRFTTVFPNMGLDDKNMETYKEWMEMFIRAFVEKYRHTPGDSATKSEIEKHAMALAVEEMVEKLHGFAELTEALSELILAVNLRGKLPARAKALADKISTKWPKSSKAFCNFAGVLLTSGAIALLAFEFLDWKELSAVDKGRAVANLLQLSMDFLAKVPKFEGFIGLSEIEILRLDMQFEHAIIDGLNFQRGFEHALAPLVEEGWRARAITRIGKTWESIKNIPETVSEARTTVGRWIGSEASLGRFMKGFGVALAFANAVFSTINFIEDFKNGASDKTKALDGIMMGAAVFEIVGLLAPIPYLAPIAALIGVVAALVSIFSPEKPKNPLDDFRKDVLEPFLKSLPDPNKKAESVAAAAAVEGDAGDPALASASAPAVVTARGVALHPAPPSNPRRANTGGERKIAFI